MFVILNNLYTLMISNKKSQFLFLCFYDNNIYLCCECCKLCCLICKKPKIPEMSNLTNDNKDTNNDNNDQNNDDKDPNTDEEDIIYNSKIDSNKKLFENREERCIMDFTILDNDKIAICYKGGIFNIYKFTYNDNKFLSKNIIHIEDDEYCFNKVIKLNDNKIALVSEDGTFKIYKIEFNSNTYQPLQKIIHNQKDPIYTILELKNGDLVFGCHKEIIIYNLNNDNYEEKKRYFFNTYCFSILEIEPNIISITNCDTKKLFIIDLNKCNDKNININELKTEEEFNNKGITKIDNIKSGEYSENQIYLKDKSLLFICSGENDSKGGINIIDIKNNKLLKYIDLDYSLTSLCVINKYNKDNNTFEILGGSRKRIYCEKVNFKYDIIQFEFDLKDINNINFKVTSQLERVHYYEITKIQNSLYSKIDNNLIFNKNSKNQIIFSIGSEDKLIKIFKV